MSSVDPRRRLAAASKLLAVLLGSILGLSMIAIGCRVGVGWTADGASLRDGAGGDQAWNQDTPGQPPLRLCDGELQSDGSDGDGDDSNDAVNLADSTLAPCDASHRWITFVARPSEAAQRVRQGNGARGPPLA